MKEVRLWECDICGGIGTKKEVEDCEQTHASLKNLAIIDLLFVAGMADVDGYGTDPRYPNYLLVEDENYSGRLALYKLDHASSFEDFEDEIGWKERIRKTLEAVCP